ncbi:MAG: efflux RND transporter permease subunit [Deinococcota bacterium]
MGFLIQFFVKRFVMSISLFAGLVLFGLISYSSIGINFLPELTFPIVGIEVDYSGAGAEEVAEQVSEPIEGVVATMPRIRNVRSWSSEGNSFVLAEFQNSVNVDQAAIDVNQRVSSLGGALPEGASTPTVLKYDPSEDPILSLAISAPGESLQVVQEFIDDDFIPEILKIEGVADASINNTVQREVQVLADPNLLESYSVSTGQLASSISGYSSSVGMGALDAYGERTLLTGRSELRSVSDIEQVLIDPTRQLKVSDVAVVRDSIEEQTGYVRLDGEPVTLIDIRKVAGSNSVAAADGVRQMIADFDFPEGYRIETSGDDTEFISMVVADTWRESLASIAAVAFVVLLFIGKLGTVASVVLAIPISITATFILFALAGYTFNVMTLLAITVAVGLVVDDSIVIAENIDRYRERGYNPREAVFKGAAEVSAAVLASTLSLLAVFLPISFLPGLVGQLFAQFGLTLATIIFFSYIEASFFLTVRLAYLPNPLPANWQDARKASQSLPRDMRWGLSLYRRIWSYVVLVIFGLGAYAGLRTQLDMGIANIAMLAGGLVGLPLVVAVLRYVLRLVFSVIGAILLGLYDAGNWLIDRLRHLYARSLKAALNHATVLLVIAFGLFLSLIYVVPRVGLVFEPPIDDGQVSVRLTMPVGSDLDSTNAVAIRVEDSLEGIPEIDTILTNVRGGRANLSVDLVPAGEREVTTLEMNERLLEVVQNALLDRPEVGVRVGGRGARSGSSRYEVTLVADSLTTLQDRNDAIVEVLEQHPNLFGAESGLGDGSFERVFTLSSDQLAFTGLTPDTVYQTIRSYNVGRQAAIMRGAGDEVPIMVRVDPRHIPDEEALLSLSIFAPGLQRSLPLRSVGEFVLQQAPTTLARSDQAYSISYSATLTQDNPGLQRISTDVESSLQEAGLLDRDLTVSQNTRGSSDDLDDLLRYGPIALGLAVLLNYLVIASQFNTFVYPLYLLLTVPLALVGAFWTFYFTDTSFDVISVLGIVLLTGLVTKNAILLLDVAVAKRAEGMPLRDALVEAGRNRLRPIFMTAGTVIIITVPMLLGFGEGSEFRRPLGLVIFSGVMVSTLLTLFIVPAAFYRFERRHEQDQQTRPQDSSRRESTATQPRAQSKPQVGTVPVGSD